MEKAFFLIKAIDLFDFKTDFGSVAYSKHRFKEERDNIRVLYKCEKIERFWIINRMSYESGKYRSGISLISWTKMQSYNLAFLI